MSLNYVLSGCIEIKNWSFLKNGANVRQYRVLFQEILKVVYKISITKIQSEYFFKKIRTDRQRKKKQMALLIKIINLF